MKPSKPAAAHPRKIAIQELPEAERPRQLLPLAKTLTDTVKMIAYRAIALLLEDLTTTNFRHPDTGHRFIYQLV